MSNGFPQTRTSNAGRSYTVRRSEDDPDVLIVEFEGREVGELHPPGPDAPERTDGLETWRVTFEAWPETEVLGLPGDPPISNALDYVDQSLDAEDE